MPVAEGASTARAAVSQPGVSRVALLTNIPAPYRLPMFRELGRRYRFEAIFDAPSEANRQWEVPDELGFGCTYVRGIAVPYWRNGPTREERWLQLRYGVLPALARFRPDVIVSGEMGPRSLQAMLYAKLRRIPLLLWWEGTQHTEGWVPGWKQRLRRSLVRGASRFWANGRESAELLKSYGARDAQIDEGMIGIDTHRFAAAVERSLPERAAFREALGVSGTVFLFVGQFAPRKGVREFLRALEAMKPGTGGEFSVLFVGAGAFEPVLREWIETHPQVRARIVPFQQPDRIPPYYAAADVFVLPTLEDNWSLVALEAAAAGLPQVFSPYNGATSDLMRLGAPGERVDPRATSEFAACLTRFAQTTPPRVHSEILQKIACAYSPEECTRRAVQSIGAALGKFLRAGALAVQ